MSLAVCVAKIYTKHEVAMRILSATCRLYENHTLLCMKIIHSALLSPQIGVKKYVLDGQDRGRATVHNAHDSLSFAPILLLPPHRPPFGVHASSVRRTRVFRSENTRLPFGRHDMNDRSGGITYTAHTDYATPSGFTRMDQVNE